MSHADGPTDTTLRRTSRVSEDGSVLHARQHHLPPMAPHTASHATPSPSATASVGAEPRKPSLPSDAAARGPGRPRGGRGVGCSPGMTGMKALQPRPVASPPAVVPTAPVTPSHPAHTPAPACGCQTTADAFLRGVDVLNRVFASTASADGLTAPHVDVWRRDETSSVTAHGDTDSRQMTRVSAPLLPVVLVTDGVSLVLVDANGTSHHSNHRALLLNPSPHEKVDPHAAHAPLTACWTLDQLQRGGRPDASQVLDDVVTVPVASAVAWTAGGKVHGQAALTALRVPYGGDASRALVVLIRDAAVVHDALHDVCHCYLPAVLHTAYAHGVPLRGVWVTPHTAVGRAPRARDAEECREAHFSSPAALWVERWQPQGPSGATALPQTAPGTDAAAATRVLHQLYPSIQQQDRDAVAAAQLGHLALPSALLNTLRYASFTASQSAATTTERRLEPHTPPLPSSVDTHASTPRPHFARQLSPGAGVGGGRVLGGGDGGRGVSRLITLRGDACRQQGQATEDEATATTSPPPPPPAPQDGEIASSASPSPWGARGDGMYYGTYTATRQVLPADVPAAGAKEETVLCRSVLLYTPRGRIELECTTESLTDAARPVVTVHDVREGFLRSALGRSLRLRRDMYEFVYAPGMPPLSDAEVLTTPHAVLRLVRLDES